MPTTCNPASIPIRANSSTAIVSQIASFTEKRPLVAVRVRTPSLPRLRPHEAAPLAEQCCSLTATFLMAGRPHDAPRRNAGHLVRGAILRRQRIAISAGWAAYDAPLEVAGVGGGIIPWPVVGHRSLYAEDAAVVVRDDQIERLGGFFVGHGVSLAQRAAASGATRRCRKRNEGYHAGPPGAMVMTSGSTRLFLLLGNSPRTRFRQGRGAFLFLRL